MDMNTDIDPNLILKINKLKDAIKEYNNYEKNMINDIVTSKCVERHLDLNNNVRYIIKQTNCTNNYCTINEKKIVPTQIQMFFNPIIDNDCKLSRIEIIKMFHNYFMKHKMFDENNKINIITTDKIKKFLNLGDSQLTVYNLPYFISKFYDD
jgi:hypothetical protein